MQKTHQTHTGAHGIYTYKHTKSAGTIVAASRTAIIETIKTVFTKENAQIVGEFVLTACAFTTLYAVYIALKVTIG